MADAERVRERAVGALVPAASDHEIPFGGRGERFDRRAQALALPLAADERGHETSVVDRERLSHRSGLRLVTAGRERLGVDAVVNRERALGERWVVLANLLRDALGYAHERR